MFLSQSVTISLYIVTVFVKNSLWTKVDVILYMTHSWLSILHNICQTTPTKDTFYSNLWCHIIYDISCTISKVELSFLKFQSSLRLLDHPNTRDWQLWPDVVDELVLINLITMIVSPTQSRLHPPFNISNFVRHGSVTLSMFLLLFISEYSSPWSGCSGHFCSICHTHTEHVPHSSMKEVFPEKLGNWFPALQTQIEVHFEHKDLSSPLEVWSLSSVKSLQRPYLAPGPN